MKVYIITYQFSAYDSYSTGIFAVFLDEILAKNKLKTLNEERGYGYFYELNSHSITEGT